MFDFELMADQDFGGAGGTSKCDPHVDPLDPVQNTRSSAVSVEYT